MLLLVPLQSAASRSSGLQDVAAKCRCDRDVFALELGCWCCCRVPLQGAAAGCCQSAMCAGCACMGPLQGAAVECGCRVLVSEFCVRLKQACK